MKNRIALVVSYQGQRYSGWQHQVGVTTIQGCVEQAISKVANEKVQVIAAGRTDKGVHAHNQVIHFDTHTTRTLHQWLLGTNHFLPHDIRIKSSHAVQPDFHARFSAIKREYIYLIRNHTNPCAHDLHRNLWFRQPLDVEKMHLSAQSWVGTHDFSSFRAAACQAHSPVRRIDRLSVQRQQDLIEITIEANAFLYHMVRNMVGTLCQVGTNEKPTEWTKQLLAAKDRKQAGPMAAADGLYLNAITYPTPLC